MQLRRRPVGAAERLERRYEGSQVSVTAGSGQGQMRPVRTIVDRKPGTTRGRGRRCREMAQRFAVTNYLGE
jgi:hypothetical protein